jgi:hypothetical protein
VKRIFIIALILLLPLRGWSAEIMSIQIASSMTTISIAKMEADTAVMEMPVDCPMMSMATGFSPVAKSGATMDHKTCKTCQLCMPLVALDSKMNVFAPNLPHITPVWSVSTFASAVVSRDSKPPIL